MSENLTKQLTFIDVFSLAAGAMISSGIFILPGLAFDNAGPAMIISYGLAGILALTGVFSVAELSTAMPRAGGDYYYVNRSMGPLLGTVSGLLSWFALSLKTAFAIFGIAGVIFSLLPDMGIAPSIMLKLIAMVSTLLFVGLNIFGVKEAAKLEVILVVFLLVLMGAYFMFGISHVEVSRFEPFLLKENGFAGMLTTAGLVFVSFGGLLKVSSVAEEVKDPQRNIPLGMIAAVLIVTTMYVLLLIVTVGVLDRGQLNENNLTPLADAARVFFGKPGYIALTVAAMLAFVTTANAGIMSASRYPMALSRDKLLPEFISKINPRFDTPVRSVVLTGGFIILALFLPLEVLVKAASTVVLTSYVLANLAIIILRESKLQNYRPSFKSPLYPWIQIVSILVFTFLIIYMGIATAEISAGLIAIALLTYFFYGMKRSKSEYAWLHLMARLGNKELESYDLESELKGIIHNRDEVVQDAFDRVISDAEILDIDDTLTKNDLFETIANTLAKSLKQDEKDLKLLLHERESESSTVLTPFVAIPHIMVPGEHVFKMLLVRCKNGVQFSEEAPDVKAVFVIVGTKDERRLHLQGLAAIAQTIQSAEFEKRWKEALGENHLRDVMLLSKRQRFS